VPADLIKEAKELPVVGQKAAEAYEAHLQAMIDRVNTKMEMHPDIHRLIGHNPLDMMRTNHQNHARFMVSVFKYHAHELLVKVVLWVYRTYHAHGFDFDYFPVELTAWQDAVTAHLDPSQTPEIAAIYQWLIDHHRILAKLAQERPEPAPEADPELQNARETFLQALLDGNSQKCLAIAEEIAKTAKGLETLYVAVIQPCLYKIGRLWERDEISVAQEHLATATVGRLMATIFPHLQAIPEAKGRAVVTAATNEFHETGARCVADLLELDGWEVHYLGANTPSDELIRYLKEVQPTILLVSVAMPFNIDPACQMLAKILEAPDLADLSIMVGGLAFVSAPDLWQITGAHGYAADAKGAVALARTWWKEK
jgi:MerR family transcriptional regulator, light-induced transcriptional regulator